MTRRKRAQVDGYVRDDAHWSITATTKFYAVVFITFLSAILINCYAFRNGIKMEQDYQDTWDGRIKQLASFEDLLLKQLSRQEGAFAARDEELKKFESGLRESSSSLQRVVDSAYQDVSQLSRPETVFRMGILRRLNALEQK